MSHCWSEKRRNRAFLVFVWGGWRAGDTGGRKVVLFCFVLQISHRKSLVWRLRGAINDEQNGCQSGPALRGATTRRFHYTLNQAGPPSTSSPAQREPAPGRAPSAAAIPPHARPSPSPRPTSAAETPRKPGWLLGRGSFHLLEPSAGQQDGGTQRTAAPDGTGRAQQARKGLFRAARIIFSIFEVKKK